MITRLNIQKLQFSLIQKWFCGAHHQQKCRIQYFIIWMWFCSGDWERCRLLKIEKYSHCKCWKEFQNYYSNFKLKWSLSIIHFCRQHVDVWARQLNTRILALDIKMIFRSNSWNQLPALFCSLSFRAFQVNEPPVNEKWTRLSYKSHKVSQMLNFLTHRNRKDRYFHFEPYRRHHFNSAGLICKIWKWIKLTSFFYFIILFIGARLFKLFFYYCYWWDEPHSILCVSRCGQFASICNTNLR